MKKQFFLVLLLTVFSLILVENIKAQEGISTYSTVNYDAANNTVSGYSYTYATYANSGYYDPQVTSYIADSDDNVLDSQTVLGRSNASALLFANGTGCGEYRIVSSHSAIVQYYATAYFYNNEYRDGYYDLFDYLQFSEQGQSYPLSYSFFAPAVSSVRIHDYSEIVLGYTENTDFTSCFAPAVTGVTAQGATEVTAKLGNTDIIHFVTPKGSTNDLVTLTATISPDNQANRNKINWEGATESANNPLVATVSKSSAAKNVVKIKYNGSTKKELRVWVVWATVTPTSQAGPETQYIKLSYTPFRFHTRVVANTKWIATIAPTAIVDVNEANRPNFSGTPSNPPGSGTLTVLGQNLSGGVNAKWDISRRIRQRYFVNGNEQNLTTGSRQKVASYPMDEVIGNDDGTTTQEDNDPLSSPDIGSLTSEDEPFETFQYSELNVGDYVELRMHFGEFARLDIAGTWYRISDFANWRLHVNLIKVKDEQLIQVGTQVGANDNIIGPDSDGVLQAAYPAFKNNNILQGDDMFTTGNTFVTAGTNGLSETTAPDNLWINRTPGQIFDLTNSGF